MGEELVSQKIMILNSDVLDVISIEQALRDAGCEDIITQTAANGAFAKLDYENPSILVLNPLLKNLNFAALMQSIRASPRLDGMAVILFSQAQASTLEEWATEYDTHGYYSKDLGIGMFASFLHEFCRTIDEEFEDEEQSWDFSIDVDDL